MRIWWWFGNHRYFKMIDVLWKKVFYLWLKSVVTVFLLGSIEIDVMVLSPTCVVSQSMRRRWWVEFLRECFGLSYHFEGLRVMKVFRIRSLCIDCCDGAMMVITYILWELNCYKGRLRWSQVYTSKFHKWDIWTVFEKVNYVMYFRGSMDVDQSRMKEWFFELMKLMLRGVLMGVRFERIHSE